MTELGLTKWHKLALTFVVDTIENITLAFMMWLWSNDHCCLILFSFPPITRLNDCRMHYKQDRRWNPDKPSTTLQYIRRNMHTVFALLCFVVAIHWLIFPYPSGLLHWHCGNLTIAPVPAKQPWWIWINTSCEFIMNDCITTTKQSTTKPCAYFLGYTVDP